MQRLHPVLATIVALGVFVSPVGARAETPEPAAEEAEAVEAIPEAASANPVPPVDPHERVTWDALISEVERTSPLMEAARAGLDLFDAKLSQARAAWHPVFKLEAGGIMAPSLSGEGLDISVDWGDWGYLYRTRISLVQPLITFGKIAALKRAARRGLEVGHAMQEAARWELRYRAAEAWYGSLLAQELRSILDEGRKWLDKAERRMAKLKALDSDDYDQLEHLRLKTRTAEFFELEASAGELEVGAHEGLRLLLGRPEGASIRPDAKDLEPLEVELVDADRYVAIALDRHPELKQKRAEAQAKDALAQAKARSMWPDIVLVGDARLTDSDLVSSDATVLGNESLGLTGGALVGMRWKLDFGMSRAKRDEARAKALVAWRQADVAATLRELEIRRLHRKLTDKEVLVGVYRRSRKAAQGWLTAVWDLYDAGFGSFRDVMDALVQFYGKKLGYLKAVHEHNILVYKLSRAVGVDVRSLPTEALNVPGAQPSKPAPPAPDPPEEAAP